MVNTVKKKWRSGRGRRDQPRKHISHCSSSGARARPKYHPGDTDLPIFSDAEDPRKGMENERQV